MKTRFSCQAAAYLKTNIYGGVENLSRNYPFAGRVVGVLVAGPISSSISTVSAIANPVEQLSMSIINAIGQFFNPESYSWNDAKHALIICCKWLTILTPFSVCYIVFSLVIGIPSIIAKPIEYSEVRRFYWAESMKYSQRIYEQGEVDIESFKKLQMHSNFKYFQRVVKVRGLSAEELCRIFKIKPLEVEIAAITQEDVADVTQVAEKIGGWGVRMKDLCEDPYRFPTGEFRIFSLLGIKYQDISRFKSIDEFNRWFQSYKLSNTKIFSQILEF